MEVIFTRWLEKKKIIKESVLLDYIEKNNLKEKLQKIEPQKFVFSSIKWKELDENIDILKLHKEWNEVTKKFNVRFFDDKSTKNKVNSIKEVALYEIPKEKVEKVEVSEDKSVEDKPKNNAFKAIPSKLINFFKKKWKSPWLFQNFLL